MSAASVSPGLGSGAVAVTGSLALGSAAATAGAGFGSAGAVEETVLARSRPEKGFANVVFSGSFGGILMLGNLQTVGLEWGLAGSSAVDRFNSLIRLLFMGLASRSVRVGNLL